MSSPSKPKAAPPVDDAEAAAAAKAAAEAAAAVEAEAAAAEAEAAAAAPGPILVVQGPEKGRWRAGRRFGPERVIIPLADLTDEQLCAIQDDPELLVAVYFDPETV